MMLLKGLLYYLGIFIVYGAAIFGAVKLGIFLRVKKNAKEEVKVD